MQQEEYLWWRLPVIQITNVIDYVTIASTGNAQDFGDYYARRIEGGGASSI